MKRRGSAACKDLNAVRSPGHLSWYYPALAASPLALYGSYSLMDTLLDKLRKKKYQRQMYLAERDYEKALAEEYRSSRDKTASFNEVLDMISKKHESLIKEAGPMTGAMSSAKGLALTLALLLGGGGYLLSKDYFEERDPARKKLERARKLIQQRLRKEPPTLRMESGALAPIYQLDTKKEIKAKKKELQKESRYNAVRNFIRSK